jgi:hypothetical protein
MAEVNKDNTVIVSEVGPGPFVQSVTVRGHKLLLMNHYLFQKEPIKA